MANPSTHPSPNTQWREPFVCCAEVHRLTNFSFQLCASSAANGSIESKPAITRLWADGYFVRIGQNVSRYVIFIHLAGEQGAAPVKSGSVWVTPAGARRALQEDEIDNYVSSGQLACRYVDRWLTTTVDSEGTAGA